MKKLHSMLLGIFLSAGFTACNQPQTNSKPETSNAPIKVETPQRAQGQTDVLNLTTNKLDTVRVGIIGLGMRGYSAVERYMHIEGAKITALCERPDVDLVYIVTDWKHHTPMALYAMQHGKHVAIEVPAALDMDEIWALIDTSEKTRRHCMMLENCVYDYFEITTLNMVQQGLLGEVIHGEGSYIHNLDEFWTEYWNNWRLDYNHKNRGDVYPTHGIGPVCQALNIHRGDKMNYLVSVDTKPFRGKEVYQKVTGKDAADFQNGDLTITMIKTEQGKTIQIQHDVVTPRPYSRMYQLTGTKGFANKYPMEGYLLQPESVAKAEVPNHENLSAHNFMPEDAKKALMEKYKPRILKDLEEQAKKVGGHGGMDFIMDYRLIYCLRNGLPLDMDVYDLAEWCCLSPLSKLSLENGSAPVEIPDFTRGAWNKQKGYKHAFVN